MTRWLKQRSILHWTFKKSLVKLVGKQKKSKLHMSIKQIHKSLASVNKKTFFYISFSSIATQTKKQKQPFSMSTLLVELISILVKTSKYFNYDFDLIFFILVHDSIVNWWSWTLVRLDKHQNLREELCAEVLK